MKRLRTWCWPDPQALSRQLVRGAWGGSYWKRISQRKAQERQQRVLASMGVYALPVLSIQPAGEPEPVAPGPVVVH